MLLNSPSYLFQLEFLHFLCENFKKEEMVEFLEFLEIKSIDFFFNIFSYSNIRETRNDET